MADEIDDLEHDDDDGQNRRGWGLMALVKAAAFISVIVIVEVVAAALLIPSAQETEDLGRQIAAASVGEEASTAGSDARQQSGVDIEDISEVYLGTYNVTRYNPETKTTLTIDIEVYGSLLADEVEDFNERFEKNKGRVGEQVIMTLHSAETADLTDAGLGLIKRKILEKTNRALGKPLIREVLFSKFNFVER